jgi:hypothetical protein
MTYLVAAPPLPFVQVPVGEVTGAAADVTDVGLQVGAVVMATLCTMLRKTSLGSSGLAHIRHFLMATGANW